MQPLVTIYLKAHLDSIDQKMPDIDCVTLYKKKFYTVVFNDHLIRSLQDYLNKFFKDEIIQKKFKKNLVQLKLWETRIS